MTDPKDFLRQLHKNLQILQEREAKHAGNAPLELLNQIEDHRTAIDLTEQVAQGQLSQADWQEALAPLLVAIDQRAGEAAIIGSQLNIGDIGNITIQYDIHFHGDAASPSPTAGAADSETKDYDRRKMRNLLNDIFSADELRDYCFYESPFRPVHDDLTDNDRKSEMLRKLIDHAVKKGLEPHLLTWARQTNPARYERDAPYTV